MTGGPRRPLEPSARVEGALVLLLAAVAGVVAVAVNRLVFPHFSLNHDEPVYVFQARMLLEGHLTLPVDALTEHFRPWMSGVVGDRLVMVFPPVMPAALALGMKLAGTPLATLAVLAGAGVLLTDRLARAVTGDRAVGLLAAAFLAAGPLFIVHTGLYLSYVLAVDLLLALAVLAVRGAATDRGATLAGAGAVAGVLAFARPLDAVLAGGPLLLAALLVPPSAARLARRPADGCTGEVRPERRWARPVRRLALVGLGALPVVALGAAYNAAVTGSPLRLPLEAIGGDNRAGFGARQIAEGTPAVHYTVGRAVWATAQNVAALPDWLPGGMALVVLAAVGFARLGRNPWRWALLAPAVTAPIGYTFYWGNLLVVIGRPTIGPHYYLAALMPASVLAAVAVRSIARTRPRAALAIGATIVASSLVTTVGRLELNAELGRPHLRERAAIDAANLAKALVIIPSAPDGAWVGHPRPSFINDPGLDGPVLYAADRSGDNLALFDAFPDRSIYRHVVRGTPGTPTWPEPHLWRLHRVSAPEVAIDVVVRGLPEGTPVIAYVTDGKRSNSYALPPGESGVGGEVRLAWTLSPAGAVLHHPGAVPVEQSLASPLGQGTLAVGVEVAPAHPAPAAAAGSATHLLRIEERRWYRTAPAGAGERLELIAPGERWELRAGPPPAWWPHDDQGGIEVRFRPADSSPPGAPELPSPGPQRELSQPTD